MNRMIIKSKHLRGTGLFSVYKWYMYKLFTNLEIQTCFMYWKQPLDASWLGPNHSDLAFNPGINEVSGIFRYSVAWDDKDLFIQNV